MIYIIGAGGVGSWLTPSICLLKNPEDVCVIDGDKLEAKNLNRQLFTPDDIGLSKAEAISKKYRCSFRDGYYSHGMMDMSRSDVILGCVDNNPARSAILQSCDSFGCKAIFGANEVTSAEAYYYEPSFQGKGSDPRSYIPEITEDHTADPRHATIGCTGEAQQANRQLVSANFMAAALMQHLYVIWLMERKKMDKEVLPHLPYRIVQNLTAYETHKLKDII